MAYVIPIQTYWISLRLLRRVFGASIKKIRSTKLGRKSMADRTLMSDEFARKFASEKDTPYERWVRDQGLDIISAQYVPNLKHVELKPWARRGGSGVFINHEASRSSNDCYVCEIPKGGKLAPQRQLFEEMIEPDPAKRVSIHHVHSKLMASTLYGAKMQIIH